MTPHNIIQGFKITGISPFDRDIFQESDFAPSLVFNPVLEQVESPVEETNVTVLGETFLHDINHDVDVTDVRPFPQVKIKKRTNSLSQKRTIPNFD